MNLKGIAKTRLLSQHIAGRRYDTPQAIVAWMGAMQAQDYGMAKWAVGVRLPNATDQSIENAISQGEILRTHLLRPTWHLVSADDLGWMLALTAPQIKATLRSRHRDLGLTNDLLVTCNTVIERALRGGKHLTREEIVAGLQAAGIPTDENRASHILMWAELDGLVCSGAVRHGRQTYALLEERLPQARPLPRAEALAALAGRYFASHGPATLQDFIWWSGLSTGDARSALAMVQTSLASETIGSQTYWLSDSFSIPAAMPETIDLLPAFDEFLISYTDRTASLPHESYNKTVSNNGIFRPMIVADGQVVGIWKRMLKKDMVLVEMELFKPVAQEIEKKIEAAALQYGQFVEKNVVQTQPRRRTS